MATWDDLTGKERTLLARTALRRELGQEGTATYQHGMNRLGRMGLGAEDVTALIDAAPEGSDLAQTAIDALAKRGALGGRKAGLKQTELGAIRATKTLDELVPSFQASATDAIGIGYANLQQELASVLGPMDPNSPALQAVMARYAAGRGDDTARALREITQDVEEKKLAIQAGTTSALVGIHEGIGDTVEFLRRLNAEEDALADAERGAIYGSFLGPIGGAAVGGLVGGRGGSLSGTKAGWETVAMLIEALGAIQGTTKRGTTTK